MLLGEDICTNSNEASCKRGYNVLVSDLGVSNNLCTKHKIAKAPLLFSHIYAMNVI